MARNDTVGGITLELKAELAQFTSEIKRGEYQLRSTAKEMQRSLQSVAKETERTHNSMVGQFQKISSAAQSLSRSMAGVFVGVSAAAMVREASKLSDTFSGINAKIKVNTQSQAEFNQVFNQLYDISQKNRASFEDSVTAFQNITSVAKDIGASSTDILKLTDIIQKMGKISGASTLDMANGLRGFTQALSDGNVQADEFRQITDNLPALAAQIASAAGISLGQLRNLVKQGKVSSKDLYDLTMKSAEDVDKKFTAVTATMSGAFQQMENSLTVAVGKMDKSIGTTKALAKAFEELAKGIGQAGDAFVKWNETSTGQKKADGSPLTATEKFTADQAKASRDRAAGWRAFSRDVTDPSAYFAQTDIHGHLEMGISGRGSKYLPRELAASNKQYQKDTGLDPDYLPGAQDLEGSKAWGTNAGKFKFTGTGPKGGAGGKKSDAESRYDREIKEITELVAKRKEEALELDQTAKGMDELARQYDREKRQVDSTTLSAKEKKAALDSLAKSYAEIRKQQDFEKQLKQQKEAGKAIDDFIKKGKDQIAQVDEEVKGRTNLNAALKLEAEYKDLLAKGNKGSAENVAKLDNARQVVEQAKANAVAKDSAEIYGELNEKTKQYNADVEASVTGLKEHREELERQLKGEQDISPFIQARGELEKKTNEILEEQRTKLAAIEQVLSYDPGNVKSLQDKQNAEAAINQTYEKRAQILKEIAAEQTATKAATDALKDQKDLLESITGSSAKYSQKVQELSDAFDQGKITADQYNDSLRQIHSSNDKASSSGQSFANTITGAFSNMLRGNQSLSQSFKQLGIDLANLAAKRFLLQPLEKMLGNLFNNISNSLFGGGGGGLGSSASSLAGGALGALAKGAASSFGSGAAAATGPVGAVTSSVQQAAQNAVSNAFSGVNSGSIGITKPIAALPLVAADAADIKKADFERPILEAAKIQNPTIAKPEFNLSQFTESRHKKDAFYDATFWLAVFKEIDIDRGFFKTSWFDTSSFKKPLLDSATIKNATIDGVSGLGGSASGGGFGSFLGQRVTGAIDSIGNGIVTNAFSKLLGFAGGGMYSPGMGAVQVGEQGRELFFPGTAGYIMNSAMSNMWLAMQGMAGGNPWLSGGHGGGFGAGGGGYSPMMPGGGLGAAPGSGNIPTVSYTDYALSQGMGMSALADQAEADLRSGKRQDYIQVKNIRDQANLFMGEAMSQRATSRFTQTSFRADQLPWMNINTLSKNSGVDTTQWLPQGVGQYNNGQLWGGFQAFGSGEGSEGVGVESWSNDPPPGIQQSSFNTSRGSVYYTPGAGGSITQMAAMGGGRWGSVGMMNAPNATPWNANGGNVLGGPGGVIPNLPFGSTGSYQSFGGNLALGGDLGSSRSRSTLIPPENYPDYMQRVYGQGNPNTTLAPDMVPGLLTGNGSHTTLADMLKGMEYMQAGRVMPGNSLPFHVTDSFDVRSNNSGAFGGGDFGGSDMSGGLNPRYMGPYSPQYYNNAMNGAAIFGGMLGSIKRYGKGGKYKGKEPIMVGDMGSEILWPDSAGSVVPNNKMKEALSPTVKITLHNETGVKANLTQQVQPDGSVKMYLTAIENMMRDPGNSIHRTIKDIARGN